MQYFTSYALEICCNSNFSILSPASFSNSQNGRAQQLSCAVPALIHSGFGSCCPVKQRLLCILWKRNLFISHVFISNWRAQPSQRKTCEPSSAFLHLTLQETVIPQSDQCGLGSGCTKHPHTWPTSQSNTNICVFDIYVTYLSHLQNVHINRRHQATMDCHLVGNVLMKIFFLPSTL